jgi:DNA repair ATPase RecN
MEVEVSAEAKDKRLNRMVAISVVVLSICMALGNIKDGNIVQAMQQAKADAVDTWGEYQANRIKLHITEAGRSQMEVLAAGGAAAGAAQARIAELDRSIAKYKAQTPALLAKAKNFEAEYDAINVHDDQFDAAEALLTTAISMAAVAALAESFWLLAAGWACGGFGIFLTICGFAKLGFHPDVLSNFLG